MSKRFEGCVIKSTHFAVCYGAGRHRAFITFKKDNKRVPARKARKAFNKFWAASAGIML